MMNFAGFRPIQRTGVGRKAQTGWQRGIERLAPTLGRGFFIFGEDSCGVILPQGVQSTRKGRRNAVEYRSLQGECYG